MLAPSAQKGKPRGRNRPALDQAVGVSAGRTERRAGSCAGACIPRRPRDFGRRPASTARARARPAWRRAPCTSSIETPISEAAISTRWRGIGGQRLGRDQRLFDRRRVLADAPRAPFGVPGRAHGGLHFRPISSLGSRRQFLHHDDRHNFLARMLQCSKTNREITHCTCGQPESSRLCDNLARAATILLCFTRVALRSTGGSARSFPLRG